MTKTNELISIAEEALFLMEHTKACLGGSLNLYLRGIDLQRTPKDVDILLSKRYSAKDIVPPAGFKLSGGRAGSKVAHSPQSADEPNVVYINPKTGVVVDYLFAEVLTERIGNFPCCTLKEVALSKADYLRRELSSTTRNKHAIDLMKIIDSLL